MFLSILPVDYCNFILWEACLIQQGILRSRIFRLFAVPPFLCSLILLNNSRYRILQLASKLQAFLRTKCCKGSPWSVQVTKYLFTWPLIVKEYRVFFNARVYSSNYRINMRSTGWAVQYWGVAVKCLSHELFLRKYLAYCMHKPVPTEEKFQKT